MRKEFWTGVRSQEEYDNLVASRTGEVRKIEDFKAGEIWQMSPGYYTTNPYYFEILLVTENFIVTNIPDAYGHIFDIRDQGTWNIQTPRMTFIGAEPEHKKLIYDQRLD